VVAPTHSDRLARIVDALRAAGTRITSPRRAVIEAFVAADGHVTADDLATAVEAAHAGVNRSTVYRTLDALERLGVIAHVHLGHGRAVYHLADDIHPHLVCDDCGAVIEVANTLFEDLAGDLEARYGFAIRPHHFAVLGRCRQCR
jgi:Fe2+ or Zn2+ uptake regulation protein